MLFRLLCIFLATLASCTKKEDAPKNDDKIKVLSTTAMIGDLVQEIGTDKVDSSVLIVGDLDPHTYELVKGDDEKFHDADLVFYNGLGLEHGLSLAKLLEECPHAHALGESIKQKDPNLIIQMDGQTDPHIWMDISLWAKTIDPIVFSLSQKAPQYAEEFVQRGASLHQKLLTLDQMAYEKLQHIPQENRYLVTTHNAFHYFTRRYLAAKDEEKWQTRVTAPEGLAPDAEISLADIRHMIEYINQYHVAVLFPESNLNKDALKKIVSASHEMGNPLRLSEKPIYGDAMGEESYIKMMTHNIEWIAKELERR